MAFESLNDEKINELIVCPKRVTNPGAKSKNKGGHEQFNYKVIATNDSDQHFEIFKRQNLREGMKDDFSCGLSWIAPNGEIMTLKRYNGPIHNHPNYLENEKLGYNCHIHVATEKYIRANRKAEGFAETTNRYNSVEGAFHCLVVDCKITGIQTKSDDVSQTRLEF